MKKLSIIFYLLLLAHVSYSQEFIGGFRAGMNTVIYKPTKELGLKQSGFYLNIVPEVSFNDVFAIEGTLGVTRSISITDVDKYLEGNLSELPYYSNNLMIGLAAKFKFESFIPNYSQWSPNTNESYSYVSAGGMYIWEPMLSVGGGIMYNNIEVGLQISQNIPSSRPSCTLLQLIIGFKIN